MSSFDLHDGEVVVRSDKPSFMLISMHVLLTFFTMFLWTPVLIYKIIEINRTKYTLTTDRLISECGVFSLSSKESPLSKTQNISHYQPFFGRLFNYGDVTLQTAAGGGFTVLYGISSPAEYKKIVLKQVEDLKERNNKLNYKPQHESSNGIIDVSMEAEMTKKCPQCAEYVRSEAKICRFCSSSFEEVQ